MSARRPEATVVAEVDDFKAFLRATRESSATTTPDRSPEQGKTFKKQLQPQNNPSGTTTAATSAAVCSVATANSADTALVVSPVLAGDQPAVVTLSSGPTPSSPANQQLQPVHLREFREGDPRNNEQRTLTLEDLAQLKTPLKHQEQQGLSLQSARADRVGGRATRYHELAETNDRRDTIRTDLRRTNGIPAALSTPDPVELVQGSAMSNSIPDTSVNATPILMVRETGTVPFALETTRTAPPVTPLSRMVKSQLAEMSTVSSASAVFGPGQEVGRQPADELQSVEQELRYFATKKKVLVQASLVQGLRDSVKHTSAQLVEALEYFSMYQKELHTLEVERGELDTSEEVLQNTTIPGLERFDAAHGIDILNYLDDVERLFIKEEIPWSYWASLLASNLPKTLREAVKYDWRSGDAIHPWNWSAIKQSVGSKANGCGDLASFYLSKLQNLEWDPAEEYLGFTQKALTYYIQWANAAGYPEKVRDGEQLQRDFLLKAVLDKLPEPLTKDLPMLDKLTWREASTLLDEAYKHHCGIGTLGITSQRFVHARLTPTSLQDVNAPVDVEVSQFSEGYCQSHPCFSDCPLVHENLQQRADGSPPVATSLQRDDRSQRTGTKEPRQRARCRHDPCYNPKCTFAHEAGQRQTRDRSTERSRSFSDRRLSTTKLFTVECRNNPCNRPNCTFKHTHGQKEWGTDQDIERAHGKRQRNSDHYDNRRDDYYHRSRSVSPGNHATGSYRDIRPGKDAKDERDGLWESRDSRDREERRRSAHNGPSGSAASDYARGNSEDVPECRDQYCDDLRCPYRHSYSSAAKRNRRSEDAEFRSRDYDPDGRAASKSDRPWQADINCRYKPCTNRNCKYRHREGQWRP